MNKLTKPWLIGLAASAGGLHALRKIISGLPCDFPAAVVIVLHRTPQHESALPQIFQRLTRLPVMMAEYGQEIRRGVVYIARPDYHLVVTPEQRFAYHDGRRIRFVRSSANPLFESAATAFGGRFVAVVLTGTGADATDGVQSVKAHGGLVIAQDQASSEHWDMPRSAVRTGAVDYVLPLEAIAPALEAVVHGRPVTGGIEAV